MDVKADHEPHTQGLHRTTNTVVDVIKRLLDFTSKSTLILDRLRELQAALELLDTLTNLVGKIILPVYDLKNAKAEHIITLKTEVHQLRIALEKGHRFVCKVQDCSRQQELVAQAKTGIRSENENFEPLLFLLDEISLHLEEAGRYYKEFYADFDKARECSIRASEECLTKSEEAHYSKVVVWVAGGTAVISLTAGIVGGGYATSTALSAGMSVELASLGVAIGAALTVGTTAAVFTHKTAKQLNEVEGRFKEIGCAFRCVASTTSALLETAYRLKCDLDAAHVCVRSVQQCHKRSIEHDRAMNIFILQALDMLQDECYTLSVSTLPSDISKGLKEMKAYLSKEDPSSSVDI